MGSFWLEVKSILTTGMGTVIMTIMLVFIIILVIEFVNGSRKTNVQELFIDERSGKFSHTKYWSNVAYLVSTVVFLYMHMFLLDKIGDHIEMLWLIYLGVVAGNASVNKLISYKYGGAAQGDMRGHEYTFSRKMREPPYTNRHDSDNAPSSDSYDVRIR